MAEERTDNRSFRYRSDGWENDLTAGRAEDRSSETKHNKLFHSRRVLSLLEDCS